MKRHQSAAALMVLILAGLSRAHAAVSATQPAAAAPTLIGREVFLPGRPGVRVVANAFYTRPSGLELACFSAEQTQSDKADVMYRSFSPDNGRTWSPRERIETFARVEGGTRRRMLQPGFADPATGVLLTMIMQAVLPGDHPLEGMQHWTLRYALSRDGGRTFYHEAAVIQHPRASLAMPDPGGGDDQGPFDERHPLPGVWGGRNAAMIGDTTCTPIRLRSGEILAPIQITPVGPDGKYHNPGGGYTYTDAAVLSARWGPTGTLDWELSGLVRADPTRSTRGMIEPTLAEMPDGRVLMVLRGSNDRKPDLPGYRWYSVSGDRGRSWSPPRPWTYTGGEPFFSPSSCSQLLRHSSGRIYWIGNLCRENPRGNAPRYPLVIAEVDPASRLLIKSTRCTLNDFRPGDNPQHLSFSNFYAREDRGTRQILVHCSPVNQHRAGVPPATQPKGFDWTADAYVYRVEVGDQ